MTGAHGWCHRADLKSPLARVGDGSRSLYREPVTNREAQIFGVAGRKTRRETQRQLANGWVGDHRVRAGETDLRQKPNAVKCHREQDQPKRKKMTSDLQTWTVMEVARSIDCSRQ